MLLCTAAKARSSLEACTPCRPVPWLRCPTCSGLIQPVGVGLMLVLPRRGFPNQALQDAFSLDLPPKKGLLPGWSDASRPKECCQKQLVLAPKKGLSEQAKAKPRSPFMSGRFASTASKSCSTHVGLGNLRLDPAVRQQVLLDVLLDGDPAVLDVDGRVEGVNSLEDTSILLQNQADQSHDLARFRRPEEDAGARHQGHHGVRGLLAGELGRGEKPALVQLSAKSEETLLRERGKPTGAQCALGQMILCISIKCRTKTASPSPTGCMVAPKMAVRAMLDDLLKLADHLLTWRRRTRPVSMTRREELEHRAATHCRECLASFETAEKKLHHCHGTGQYLGALRLLQHRGPDAQDHPSGLSQRGRLRLPLPAALHRHDGLSCQQGAARRARRGQRERGRRKRAREAHAQGQGCAKAQGQGQGRAKAPHRLATKQGDYSHLCLRVLCKSGEKCLQMS